MPKSDPTQSASHSPFVITTYRVDVDGSLAPDIPDRCPRAATSGEQDPCCSIARDHYRDRKSGPGHRLQVVRCRVHGIAFTLYPPGFAPYRREPVAVVGPDGAQLDTDESSTLSARFGGTLFEAALDAYDGTPWARECGDAPANRWWSTQSRHLKLAARLVGVARGLPDRAQEVIARVLAIDTLSILESKLESGGRGQGYRACGESIVSVVGRLRGAAAAAIILLRCGHWVGQWGEPLHWDSMRRVYNRYPFPVPRAAQSP
jgi:hypothetical protein